MNKKERRSRLEIYYDILKSIQNESARDDTIKPTRLQYGSNLAYDKLMNYLNELHTKNMIKNKENIVIDTRGRQFLEEYCSLRGEVEKLGMEFL